MPAFDDERRHRLPDTAGGIEQLGRRDPCPGSFNDRARVHPDPRPDRRASQMQGQVGVHERPLRERQPAVHRFGGEVGCGGGDLAATNRSAGDDGYGERPLVRVGRVARDAESLGGQGGAVEVLPPDDVGQPGRNGRQVGCRDVPERIVMDEGVGRHVELGLQHRDRHRTRHALAIGGQHRLTALGPSAALGGAQLEPERGERNGGQQLDREPGERAILGRELTGEQRRHRRTVEHVGAPRADGADRRDERRVPVGEEQRGDAARKF